MARQSCPVDARWWRSQCTRQQRQELTLQDEAAKGDELMLPVKAGMVVTEKIMRAPRIMMWGRSNARGSRKKRTDRSREDDEDSREEKRGHPRNARGTVGAVARGREAREHKRPTPLDMMLEDEGADPLKSKANDRFEELRHMLQEKKKGEPRSGASAVLARRVQEGAENESKKRKKDSEKDKVQEALRVLSKRKAAAASSSCGSDSDDGDDDGLKLGPKDSDLAHKQKRLRKMSQAKPGCLLTKGFQLMHEQLGTLFGDRPGSTSHDELLHPAALRYLMSSALPLMDVRKVGEEKLRELRTLATSLDMIVAGRVGQAGDHLMQRMKSLLMGIRDGTSTASRYLELIPMELYQTASTLEETDYARTLAVRNAKSEKLLEQVKTRG